MSFHAPSAPGLEAPFLSQGPSFRGCPASRECRASAGFTLLEVMVAVVITGLVALLTYGAARVAMDTRDRMDDKALEIRVREGWRGVVQDALRNTAPAPVFGDTAFFLEDGTRSGRPADRAVFVTAGSMPPLTPDSDWLVILEVSEEGLVLRARPLGLAEPVLRVATRPEIRGFDMRVLDPGPPAQWRESWPLIGEVPRALEITYWTEEGPSGSPQLLRLPLGGTQW